MSYSNRRKFLHSIGSGMLAGGTGAIACDLGVGTAHADESKRVTSELAAPNSEVKRLMKLIADTPQDKCVEVMSDQFRKGVPYRIALAALFLRTIDYNTTHTTLATHSAHRMSLDVPEQQRLIPFFWALNHSKTNEETRDWAKPGHFRPLTGKMPSPEQADKQFVEGMEEWDSEKAKRGLIALARRESQAQIFARLWPYAARNMGFIGHYAIALANGNRTLRVIGWKYHEQFLRMLIEWLCLNGPSGNLVDGPGPQYNESLARSKQVQTLKPGWRYRGGNREASVELLNVIRSGESKAACDLAFAQLKSGKVQAGAIWDGVHLASAEFLMRPTEANHHGGRPVHANTSSNALDYVFRSCNRADVSLLTLLEAVDWVTETVGAWKGHKLPDGKPVLRDLRVVDLQAADDKSTTTSSTGDAVEAIFAGLPSYEERYADDNAGAPREAQDKAVENVFSLLQTQAGQTAFERTARSYVLSKAGNNAHHYKYWVAALENVRHVSPEWRPNYLAASVHYGFGPATPDNGLIRRAIRG